MQRPLRPLQLLARPTHSFHDHHERAGSEQLRHDPRHDRAARCPPAVRSSGTANWTSIAVGTAATPVPITIDNTGDAAASITVTQPTATQFVLQDSGGAAATTLSVPAATGTQPGTVAVKAAFTPTFVGELSDNAELAVTGPVCTGGGANASEVIFDGTGSGQGLLAAVTTQFPARVDCGATGAGLPTATISRWEQLQQRPQLHGEPARTQFAVSTGRGRKPHRRTSIGAAHRERLAGRGARRCRPGNGPFRHGHDYARRCVGIFGRSSAAQHHHQRRGAGFRSGDGVRQRHGNVAPTADLHGDQHGQCRGIAGPARGRNGRSLFTPGAPALAPSAVPAGTTDNPGQSTFAVTFTPPVGDSSVKSATVTLTPAASDVLCVPHGSNGPAIPAPLALSGAQSTAGFQLVTPSNGSLSFGNAGLVACPAGDTVDPSAPPTQLTAAAPLQVVFQNTGSVPMNWNASSSTQLFTMTPASDTLAPGDQATITITPSPIPFPADTSPNAYGDVLSINTGIAGDVVHNIPLQPNGPGCGRDGGCGG